MTYLDSASHAIELRHHLPTTLSHISSVLAHPRSLARPLASWRPPSLDLPQLDALSGRTPPLKATITRHRVGPRVQAQLEKYGQTRRAAYLVTLRITDPCSRIVSPAAEAWVRAFIDNDLIAAVHEVGDSNAPTFVWLVDSKFLPIFSPPSLFSAMTQAA